MRQEAQAWHMETLAQHNTSLFNTLLYPHHVDSSNMKSIVFDSKDRINKMEIRGYFAKKDKTKYFINAEHYDDLPFKVRESEELINKDDIVTHPTRIIPFKIVPEHSMRFREMVDGLLPFKHSRPDVWTLAKLISIAGFVGRTYVCEASASAFGKSARYEVMHGLTDVTPVFKPRSIPGVLNKINGVGNLVFDEAHDCKKEVKEIIEEFALAIGGGKTVYINGAMKAQKTKSKYDCRLQSITFLFNNLDQYRNPDKEYFEVIFSNNKAIGDRFLKVKLDGILTEQFDRNFDIMAVAETNKRYYIQINKELAYLQKLRQENGYVRRYAYKPTVKLTSRQRMSFDEITWLIDMYAGSELEYTSMVKGLETAVDAYKDMVAALTGARTMLDNITEEVV